MSLTRLLLLLLQAMIGIAGFVAQELRDGQEIFSSGITSDVPQAIINKS